jgi:hydrogenase maturation protein HypF
MSQHIGDLGGLETQRAFERATSQFRAIYGIEPAGVVADLHPRYRSRQWAEQSGLPVTTVQHHHAHVAALMAEHGVKPGEAIIGIAFDGTGYGTDGAIWGGEVLLATYADFERVAHLRNVALPGGDDTIRKPYRTALAHLHAAGISWDEDLEPVRTASADERKVIERQLDRHVHCSMTSSMGRLFDAVSALLGVRQVASFEGQAAIELENAAAGVEPRLTGASFDLDGDAIDPAPVLRGLVHDLRAGVDPRVLAARFHVAVAAMVVEAAERTRAASGTERVGLTGGVFQNVVLARLTTALLQQRGFTVLTHHRVPPNDGGIALGQAAVAAARSHGSEAP